MKRKYTTEFKEQALGLIRLGKPVVEVARDLEVSANSTTGNGAVPCTHRR
jgi:transposase-like protein